MCPLFGGDRFGEQTKDTGSGITYGVGSNWVLYCGGTSEL